MQHPSGLASGQGSQNLECFGLVRVQPVDTLGIC